MMKDKYWNKTKTKYNIILIFAKPTLKKRIDMVLDFLFPISIPFLGQNSSGQISTKVM